MNNRKDGDYDLLTSSLVMTIPRINILTTPVSASYCFANYILDLALIK